MRFELTIKYRHDKIMLQNSTGKSRKKKRGELTVENRKEKVNNILTNEMISEIDEFLTKKRRKVLEVLYPDKKIAHGELANVVDTSVTSLSNMLYKFTCYKYKLLKGSPEGKYCYYSLTELGREYIKNCFKEKRETNGKIIYCEASQMMLKVQESLIQLQNLYGDDEWQIVLEDALIARIECQEILQNESENIIDDFLYNVESILLYDYENYILQILDVLRVSSILQKRLSRFIEKFELFIPLLTELENGFDVFQLFEFLDGMIFDKEEIIHKYIEKLHWQKECDRLSEGIHYLADRSRGKEMCELYDIFNRYLANKQAISAFIAREIYNKIEIGERDNEDER